jgi:hypothetical protein
LSLSFALLAISVNLIDHSSQYSTDPGVSGGDLSEYLVKVLEVPFLLLLILATREFLGRLSLLFGFRSIATGTGELSAALSGWSSGGGLRGWCARLTSLDRGCSFSLFSCKLSCLTLLLDLTSFFFSLTALLLFFDLEKSGVVLRIWPQGLGRGEGFPHYSVLLKVS